MKRAISNIAWEESDDSSVYGLMKKYCFEGLEIAPTRLFSEKPYDNLEKARRWMEYILEKYGFYVPSMQSIWFGRRENMFGGEEERHILIDYTKKAIDFAAVLHCGNLVFGCPRNRNLPENADKETAISFFRELGAYAASKGVVIGMEANPKIYNTNYINDTVAALDLIKRVDSPGFRLNLDIGTMLQNGESLDILVGQVKYVNHVHISEPKLGRIKRQKLHEELALLLEAEKYQGFVSVEMEKQKDIKMIEEVMGYIKEVFHARG